MSNRRRLGRGPYRHLLQESATTTLDRATTGETTVLAESSIGGMAATATPHRYRVRIIETDRWGSSGWYGREVVARDGPVAWPIGTHLYVDHPTVSDEAERPERSIRDIAAHIVSTPVIEADGLYADIETVPHHAALVESLRKIIGLSIRADGLAESGTREGRTGPIVTAITQGHSVDLVTKAGAGGGIVSLIEAARERGLITPLREAPTEQIRQALERVVRDAYAGADDLWSWVRDFDPDRNVCWFDVTGKHVEQTTWEQSYATNGAQVALLGERRQVVAETVYRPVGAPIEPAPAITPEGVALGESIHTTDVTDGAPPTGSPTQPEEGSAMAETTTGGQPGQAGTAQVVDVAAIQFEAREAATARDKALHDLAEAQRQVASATERAVKAECELATFRAIEAARPLVDAQLAESGLPVAAQNKVRAAATSSERVPMTETRQLDQNGLRSLVEAEVTAEKAYVAQLAEANGAGQVTGFGAQPTATAQATTATSWTTPAAEPNAALVEAYRARGLTAPGAAEAAARGRAI